MPRLILGTAGHIDHGKTALVKALTGVDTDRLKEEKERGITVDLGFAEYRPQEGVRFGVVDVPGHEGFIKNMLAGATGMDLVLLVVAADEGVMPQTREHLAIVRLLGVPQLVVGVTKSDLVEADWLELVSEEVRELLQDTPYSQAPVVPVSSVTGGGLDELSSELVRLGLLASERGEEDVPRLPIDRVFTIRGTGTVVTGTLWSGAIGQGDRVRILPGEQEARVRGLQAHGEEVTRARAGGRVAVGLSGSGIHHRELFRGQTLVQGDGWEVSWMLTCRLSILTHAGWDLEQGQRVRLHLGTAEVLARVALLEGKRLVGGEEGWVQFRLEEPLLARVGDHLVIRSYSPVTTMGGGRVVEVLPRKRRTLRPGEEVWLWDRFDDAPAKRLTSLLNTAAWTGVPASSLPQRTGLPPSILDSVVTEMIRDRRANRVNDHLFSSGIWTDGEHRIQSALREFHEGNPLRPGMPLEQLRQVPPGPRGQELGEAILKELQARDEIRIREGVGALSAFRPSLSRDQIQLRERLGDLLSESPLSPPGVRDLEEMTGAKGDVEALLRLMEGEGEVLALDPDLFFPAQAVWEAGSAVVAALGGSSELGPADFRDTLPVSRKHLLPLLRYFDRVGITTRIGDGRKVAADLPSGWGTPGETSR
jgi:selenocysteine-specific elongation factor